MIRRHAICLSAFVFVAALCACAGKAPADTVGQSAWLKDRQRQFVQWREAHPNIAAQIAELKAKTAALVGHDRASLKDLVALPDAEVSRPPKIWRVPGTPREVWDCSDCPRLTIIPAGEYDLGSPQSGQASDDDLGPRHRVTIGAPLAVATYPVTRAEYERFVSQARHAGEDGCEVYGERGWRWDTRANRRRPGFAQAANHPVVCVNWDDATAYVAWLSRKTGNAYRLLSEAEYEYVARAGTTTIYWWGDQESRDHANYGADQCCRGYARGRDEWIYTSPVGSFPANPFGVYDMAGNVWEWTEDCYDPTARDAARDGSAWTEGDCTIRRVRGGSWYNVPWVLRSVIRSMDSAWDRNSKVGFRVARTL